MFCQDIPVRELEHFTLPEQCIDVYVFESIYGQYTVVMREHGAVKAGLCLSWGQSVDLFKKCVKRTQDRFLMN